MLFNRPTGGHAAPSALKSERVRKSASLPAEGRLRPQAALVPPTTKTPAALARRKLSYWPALIHNG